MVIHEQVQSMFFSPDGVNWTKTLNSTNIDHVSGFVLSDAEIGGSTLLPALFTYGTGSVVWHSFEIHELPEEDPEPEEWDY